MNREQAELEIRNVLPTCRTLDAESFTPNISMRFRALVQHAGIRFLFSYLDRVNMWQINLSVGNKCYFATSDTIEKAFKKLIVDFNNKFWPEYGHDLLTFAQLTREFKMLNELFGTMDVHTHENTVDKEQVSATLSRLFPKYLITSCFEHEFNVTRIRPSDDERSKQEITLLHDIDLHDWTVNIDWENPFHNRVVSHSTSLLSKAFEVASAEFLDIVNDKYFECLYSFKNDTEIYREMNDICAGQFSENQDHAIIRT